MSNNTVFLYTKFFQLIQKQDGEDLTMRNDDEIVIQPNLANNPNIQGKPSRIYPLSQLKDGMYNQPKKIDDIVYIDDSDDDEEPYRHLKYYYIYSKKKNYSSRHIKRIPLPINFNEMNKKNDIVIAGWIQPPPQSTKSPVFIELNNVKLPAVIDRTPLARGYWIQSKPTKGESKGAWYYLQEPCDHKPITSRQDDDGDNNHNSRSDDDVGKSQAEIQYDATIVLTCVSAIYDILLNIHNEKENCNLSINELLQRTTLLSFNDPYEQQRRALAEFELQVIAMYKTSIYQHLIHCTASCSDDCTFIKSLNKLTVPSSSSSSSPCKAAIQLWVTLICKQQRQYTWGGSCITDQNNNNNIDPFKDEIISNNNNNNDPFKDEIISIDDSSIESDSERNETDYSSANIVSTIPMTPPRSNSTPTNKRNYEASGSTRLSKKRAKRFTVSSNIKSMSNNSTPTTTTSCVYQVVDSDDEIDCDDDVFSAMKLKQELDDPTVRILDLECSTSAHWKSDTTWETIASNPLNIALKKRNPKFFFYSFIRNPPKSLESYTMAIFALTHLPNSYEEHHDTLFPKKITVLRKDFPCIPITFIFNHLMQLALQVFDQRIKQGKKFENVTAMYLMANILSFMANCDKISKEKHLDTLKARVDVDWIYTLEEVNKRIKAMNSKSLTVPTYLASHLKRAETKIKSILSTGGHKEKLNKASSSDGKPTPVISKVLPIDTKKKSEQEQKSNKRSHLSVALADDSNKSAAINTSTDLLIQKKTLPKISSYLKASGATSGTNGSNDTSVPRKSHHQVTGRTVAVSVDEFNSNSKNNLSTCESNVKKQSTAGWGASNTAGWGATNTAGWGTHPSTTTKGDRSNTSHQNRGTTTQSLSVEDCTTQGTCSVQKSSDSGWGASNSAGWGETKVVGWETQSSLTESHKDSVPHQKRVITAKKVVSSYHKRTPTSKSASAEGYSIQKKSVSHESNPEKSSGLGWGASNAAGWGATKEIGWGTQPQTLATSAYGTTSHQSPLAITKPAPFNLCTKTHDKSNTHDPKTKKPADSCEFTNKKSSESAWGASTSDGWGAKNTAGWGTQALATSVYGATSNQTPVVNTQSAPVEGCTNHDRSSAHDPNTKIPADTCESTSKNSSGSGWGATNAVGWGTQSQALATTVYGASSNQIPIAYSKSAPVELSSKTHDKSITNHLNSQKRAVSCESTSKKSSCSGRGASTSGGWGATNVVGWGTQPQTPGTSVYDVTSYKIPVANTKSAPVEVRTNQDKSNTHDPNTKQPADSCESNKLKYSGSGWGATTSGGWGSTNTVGWGTQQQTLATALYGTTSNQTPVVATKSTPVCINHDRSSTNDPHTEKPAVSCESTSKKSSSSGWGASTSGGWGWGATNTVGWGTQPQALATSVYDVSSGKIPVASTKSAPVEEITTQDRARTHDPSAKKPAVSGWKNSVGLGASNSGGWGR